MSWRKAASGTSVRVACRRRSKQDQLADLSLSWHFIGRLQSNKVRSVVRAFPVIHSVDSLPLAQRVSRIAGEEEQRPEVLLQVKLRPDANKGVSCGMSCCRLGQSWLLCHR